MKFSNEIIEELNNVSPLLAGIGKKNIFSVPNGYFDELPINIIKTINTNLKDVYPDTLKVPDGYFENLSTTVLGKIKSVEDNALQEVRSLSPMLYSIQNENVFKVPAGYFKNVSNDILHTVTKIPLSKVVQIKQRDSIWQYAAAAIVTGVIGLSSLINLNSASKTAMNKDNNISVSSSIQTASQYKNEQQINAAIATLSDDEIIKYLERNGNDIDNGVLTKSIDDNDLPSANDYLLDEKTLDTYLNQINKNSQN